MINERGRHIWRQI
jgi:hypothetical protein